MCKSTANNHGFWGFLPPAIGFAYRLWCQAQTLINRSVNSRRRTYPQHCSAMAAMAAQGGTWTGKLTVSYAHGLEVHVDLI